MTESYWQRKNRPQSGNKKSGEIPRRCDIAIVGAGLAGIAVAHFLKKLGCDDVVVLEKEFVGYGASGRNAGFLLAGLSEPYSRLQVGMGKESAKEFMHATIDNHTLIEEAISEKGIECDYSRSGSYHLAVTEVEKREYEETAELLCRDGFEAKIVDYTFKTAAGRLKGYLGGYYYPGDGCLDPLAFIRGLSKNLKVVEGFAVRQVEKANGMVRITGSRGSLDCEMAILVTNGYLPLLDGFFKKLIFPIRGQMMATSPLKTRILDGSIYYANFGYDYFRQHIDKTLLIGGLRNRYLNEEYGYEDALNQALQTDLARYARGNLGAEDIEVDSRWSGVMGGTIDGLPIVGALPHNCSVIVCGGYNGHGFGLGMIVARDIAGAIIKGDKSGLLERFSLRRFS
jgi:gamma-glutamylputrescine oxidase